MRFFKSPAFPVWIVTNILFPIAIYALLEVSDFPVAVSSPTIIITAGIILLVNIYAIRRYAAFRLWFIIIMILNVIALFLTSSPSFITSIPSLPVTIDGIYQMIQQAEEGYPN